MISGTTGAGKTIFTKQMLNNVNVLFRPEKPEYVVLVYHTWQDTYQEMYGAGLINLCLNQIPDAESLKDICPEHKDRGGVMLVIDDQLNNMDSHMVDIFTIYSHHLKITAVLLVQTLFLANTEFRNISLNSHYIILMKNTQDRSSISQLA